MYEDLATTHKIIAEAKGIVYCSKTGYFYRQRNDSIMNHRGLEERDWDALVAAKNQYEYIAKFFPGVSAAAKGRCVVAGFDLLRLIRNRTNSDKKDFRKIQEYVKPFKKDVLDSQDVNKKTKLKCRAICLGYYPAISCSLLFDFMRKKIRK